ncbi:MAG: glycosyltransferase family 2 protein [Bacteroidota bacterium]
MKVKISVVIITFNEELNIGRCLDSVKDIADEIVVVDSFSTDRTEAICKEYGVRFIKNKFDGHIEQKNFAAMQATNDHILSLDADEALSETLKQSIIHVKNNWQADGYCMNRIANYCGKWIRHSGWYPDTKNRLVDRRKGRWGGMNPHDRFIINNETNIVHLKGDILHYTYYSVDEHIIQVNKFSTIGAQSLHDKGIKSGWIKIFIKPISKFIRNYFLKAGFLDGYSGYIICRITAFETFLKYLKLKKLNEPKKI